MSVSKNFDFPAPPANSKWWVTGTSLEQLEAGDHAILTLTCEVQASNYDPSSSSGSFDPYQDTWQLRWESYTVKPAGFCANTPHQDRELTSMTGDETLTSALYHYPVLTHMTTQNHVSNMSSIISSNVKYTEHIGGDIDHV